jgi:rod shape-determining protein MreD
VIYYLFLPILLLLLVVVQVTILDLFFIGWIGLEVSLVVVIYAGFHLDAFRGGLFSLLLGFLLDCLFSTIFGLYMFLYMLIFYIAKIVEGKVYAGDKILIAVFAGLCTLLEGIVIVFIHRFIFGIDSLDLIPKMFLPQAVAVGVLSPFVFSLFHHLGVFVDVEDRQPARRI